MLATKWVPETEWAPWRVALRVTEGRLKRELPKFLPRRPLPKTLGTDQQQQNQQRQEEREHI